jgi:hypothetical protein
MSQPQEHNAAAKWFPCTLLLLGDHAETAVEQFCRESLANTCPDGFSDPERFLKHLQAVIARAPDVPGYTADVAAYEGAIAALATSDEAGREALSVAEHNEVRHECPAEVLRRLVPVVGGHVRVERYRFNAPGIVAAIEECDRLEGRDQPAQCIVLLLKTPDQPRAHALLISEGVQMLLALCDGRRDCAAVAQRLHEGVSDERADNFERRVFEAIEALRAKNVLTYREPLDLSQSEQ